MKKILSHCFKIPLNLFILSLMILLLNGCTSIKTPHPNDPLESYNRSMFMTNAAIDLVVTKPIARAYTAVVPELARDCVGNMFENIKVPFSALNNVLQGKFKNACEDMARFVINSTVGFGGCVDFATMAGIPFHKEDFGQTLGHWGVPSGPYIVLPLLGSSNVRDGIATIGQMPLKTPIDRNVILQDIDHIPTRNTLMGAKLIHTRAQLLPATDALEKMGVDEYAFVRDAAIRSRLNQVYDGDIPEEILNTMNTTPIEEDESPPVR